MLKLSNDGKTLIYEKIDKNRGLWEKIKGNGKIKLDQIYGIAYGGTTSTFKRI